MTIGRRNFLLSSTAIALSTVFPNYLVAQNIPKPRQGGTLVVHMNSEQRILNPALRASTGVYLVAAKIVEPLVDLNAAGDPDPMLATSWESSADGKEITFHLRKNVKWHDGKPFTAADVQYNAMELWKKHLNYSTALQMYLEAVDTPDEHTVVFKYSRPMPLDLLLRALADLGYVVPRHIYEGTDVIQNPANTAPIGTGPFVFKEYERGQYILVERNPEYWRKGLPYLDKIIWRIIPDSAAAAAAIESEQIHISPFSSLSLSDLNRLKDDERLVVSEKGNEGNVAMNTVEFNFRRKELADHRVREAIIRSLDIPFFTENFLYGFGKPGTGPIPSNSSKFYTPGAPGYPFDLTLAEQLLDEAGYKRQADNKRFKLRLLPAPWGEDISLFSNYLQQSLGKVGIEVEIIRLDAAGFLKTVYNDWDFDLATGWHQYRGDPAVSTTVWYRSGSPKGAPWTNQYDWQSDTVDNLIDAAAFEIDPNKRKSLYVDFVNQVNTELPLWMAVEKEFISVSSKKIHNDRNNPRWLSSHWADLWLES